MKSVRFALLLLVDCSDILGIPPTQVVPYPPRVEPSCGADAVLISDGENDIKAMVADEKALFWTAITDSSDGYIKMYDVGSDTVSTIIATEEKQQALALDPDRLYWTKWNRWPVDIPHQATIAWWDRTTATHDRGAVPLGTVGNAAGALAVDGTNLYFGTWTQKTGGVYALSLPLTSSSVPTLLAASSSPFHVAVDATNLYFDEGTSADINDENFPAGTSISSVPIAGGAKVSIATAPSIQSLGVSGGRVIWTASDAVDGFDLGTNSNAPLAKNISPAGTFAIDDAKGVVYYTTNEGATNAIMRVSIAGGASTVCVGQMMNYTFASMAFANGTLYFTVRSPTGTAIFKTQVL